jgi:hypothetical protein
MKTNTRNSTTVLGRWTRFFGAILAVALMMHAAALSQSTTVNLGTAGNFAILAQKQESQRLESQRLQVILELVQRPQAPSLDLT